MKAVGFGGVLADLRHAGRLYLKTPWQSLLAVLALATAMALVSTMAGLWSDLHLRSAPGISDDRGLLSLGRRGDFPMANLSAMQIPELNERSQTLESISGSSVFRFLNDGQIDGRPVEGRIEPVLPGYFETLRPRMLLGRGLDNDDHAGDGAQVAVISHGLWQSYFNAERSVIGREFRLNDVDWQIVGVTDPDFSGLLSRMPLMWVPSDSYDRQFQSELPAQLLENAPFFAPVLRARPGVTPEAVETELKRLVAELQTPVSSGIDSDELFVLRGLVSNPQAHEAASRQLSLMLAATLLIAVVAAFNVGIFLLARAPGRRRELALRQSLGAGRRRLGLQLVLEAGLLVVAATLSGLLASLWLAAGVKELAFLAQAGFSGQALNLPALVFAAGLAGLMTVLIALLPMAMIRRGRLGQDARHNSARPGRFQQAASLVQFSLAGAVGTAALAFVVHLWLMENRDLGMSADQVSHVQIGIEQRPGMRVFADADVAGPFRREVRASLSALPGVHSVGFMAPIPGQQSFAITRSVVDGVEVQARMINVSPGTLETLRIPLLHGRDLEDDEDQGVMVNRRYAETVWGKTDVVGYFTRHDESGQGMEGSQIIGVVGDLIFDHPDDPPRPKVFSNTQGFMGLLAGIMVRGDVDPDVLKSRVEPLLENAMDGLYVANVRPLSEQLDELTRMDRARAGITALFGGVIVLLAGFGFFAMQRFLVDSGQRETAIRMALGAGPAEVRRLVLRRALTSGLPGLVIGGLLGLILVLWLSEDLISRSVPALAIAGITVLCLAILMLIASLQPALRAARTQPGRWLRED
ncbi:MAG: ABC transporter permease [Wenzhouxiangella sp.]